MPALVMVQDKKKAPTPCGAGASLCCLCGVVSFTNMVYHPLRLHDTHDDIRAIVQLYLRRSLLLIHLRFGVV